MVGRLGRAGGTVTVIATDCGPAWRVLDSAFLTLLCRDPTPSNVSWRSGKTVLPVAAAEGLERPR